MTETNRPISEGAELIIDKYFPVLDTGFVALKDYMGTDNCIEKAARVSYGAGTRKTSQTRGLLRYLKRHSHTTPFEMMQLKFHCCMPIFVARQWIRHRTSCLSGDTLLYFDEPAATNNDKRKCKKITIQKFYDTWHNDQHIKTQLRKNDFYNMLDDNKLYSVPELCKLVSRTDSSIRELIYTGRLKCKINERSNLKQPKYLISKENWLEFIHNRPIINLSRKKTLSRMMLRSCNEETGEIIHTHINDIWSNGEKPVFSVELENGNLIKMTKDHLCLTNNGWKTLEEATGLKLGINNTATWIGNNVEFAVNGLLYYKDEIWLKQCRVNGLSITEMSELAGCSYHTIRAYLKKYNLQFSAREKAVLSGKAQRGQKRSFIKKPLSEAVLAAIRKARSGPNSNFWKGGITPERANIGRWTREHAKKVFEKYNFKCVVCLSNKKLNAHHIDPVWHNPELGRTFNNLICLCKQCHQIIHNLNLELEFLQQVNAGQDLYLFLNDKCKLPRHQEKKLSKIPKLHRTYSKLKKISFIGYEEVFDIEVDGPYHNFVANGFIVHNSVNEYSGRYSLMPMLFYTPPEEQFKKQSKDNKQGRDGVSDAAYNITVERWNHIRDQNKTLYTDLTTSDIARELARIDLPLSTYTQWYWKVDVHNLMHFLKLRVDSHAQWEIQEYGKVIAGMLKLAAPLAYEAWVDYDVCSTTFSRQERQALANILNNENIEVGLSKRETEEFNEKLRAFETPDFELDLSQAKTAEYFENLMLKAVPAPDQGVRHDD